MPQAMVAGDSLSSPERHFYDACMHSLRQHPQYLASTATGQCQAPVLHYCSEQMLALPSTDASWCVYCRHNLGRSRFVSSSCQNYSLAFPDCRPFLCHVLPDCRCWYLPAAVHRHELAKVSLVSPLSPTMPSDIMSALQQQTACSHLSNAHQRRQSCAEPCRPRMYSIAARATFSFHTTLLR